jgi:hypothetical protein
MNIQHLYNSLRTFLLKRCQELNCIHIHALCVNWSASISYSHSRACPLTGSILLGFTYCDSRERLLFPWVSYFDNREQVFMFDYDTKEKEHQNTWQSDLYSGAMSPRTNHIASCFDALSFT